jgi:lysozyme
MGYNFTHSRGRLALAEGFEGCRLSSYRDTGGIWTIGYGYTPAISGQTITLAQAEAFPLHDVRTASATVNHCVTMPGLSQDEFDSLVDFAFNAGIGAFEHSTMLRDLNAGNIAAAEAQFLDWDHVSDQVVAGLLRRRLAEEKLFAACLAAWSLCFLYRFLYCLLYCFLRRRPLTLLVCVHPEMIDFNASFLMGVSRCPKLLQYIREIYFCD